jgi:hypothetical protein
MYALVVFGAVRMLEILLPRAENATATWWVGAFRLGLMAR